MVFRFAFLIVVYAWAAVGMTFLLLFGGNKKVADVTEDIYSTPWLVAGSLAVGLILCSATLMLVGLVRRDLRGSASVTTFDHWAAVIAERKFQRESWKNKVIRDTYQQVLEQQSRGLLCPHCKGQDPGYRKSA